MGAPPQKGRVASPRPRPREPVPPHGPSNGIVVPGGQTGPEERSTAQSSTRSRFLRTRESSKSPRLMSWTVWRGQRGRRARGRTTRDRRASTSSRRSIRPRLRDQHGRPSVSWTPSVPGTRGEALSGDGRQGPVVAVAHRDYTDSSSVQVMLFSDRVEVMNSGGLPPTLTVEKLRVARWEGPLLTVASGA